MLPPRRNNVRSWILALARYRPHALRITRALIFLKKCSDVGTHGLNQPGSHFFDTVSRKSFPLPPKREKKRARPPRALLKRSQKYPYRAKNRVRHTPPH